jgi:site-specific DNA recombinase
VRCVIYLRVSTKEQVEKDLTEEGFSIAAQREACVRRIRDEGWELVDEYVDKGESARTADRPQLRAMLARIGEDADVEAVVVHKIDRLARNMEDHVAIRALLRRRGVALVSVTENLDETASGRLVEGIHALMAEFYSANLANEVRKGMGQKAKLGGYPHKAPLGYLNLREPIGGRQVAHIVPDPERAPLVKAAFELYATGEWTVERLAEEMAHRGLRNRGRDGHYSAKALTVSGLAHLLAHRAYVGVVEWDGVTYPASHEPIVERATFDKVQELLAARAVRGTRERRHHHYLKGLLVCGVCNRRLSIQHSKGTYTYFYCLGQKDRRNPSGCQERYIAADQLEAEVEDLYGRIEVPDDWAEGLREAIASEVATHHEDTTAERELLARRREHAEAERFKLLGAYYANAIDVQMLRHEQDRIGAELRAIEARQTTLDASLEDWQEVMDLALRFSTRCGAAYRRGSDRARRLFNAAVLDDVRVRDGHVVEAAYKEPFDLLFSVPKFEFDDVVELTGFEPVASWLQTRRSNQLSYSPAPFRLRERPRSSARLGAAPRGAAACRAASPQCVPTAARSDSRMDFVVAMTADGS